METLRKIFAKFLPGLIPSSESLELSICSGSICFCGTGGGKCDRSEIIFEVVRFKFVTEAWVDFLRRFFNSELKSVGKSPIQPDFDLRIPFLESGVAKKFGGGGGDVKSENFWEISKTN